MQRTSRADARVHRRRAHARRASRAGRARIPAAVPARHRLAGTHLVRARRPGHVAGLVPVPRGRWHRGAQRAQGRSSSTTRACRTFGIQITQETAEWARNDLWGTLSMTHTPGVVADEAAVRREFRRRAPARGPRQAMVRAAGIGARPRARRSHRRGHHGGRQRERPRHRWGRVSARLQHAHRSLPVLPTHAQRRILGDEVPWRRDRAAAARPEIRRRRLRREDRGLPHGDGDARRLEGRHVRRCAEHGDGDRRALAAARAERLLRRREPAAHVRVARQALAHGQARRGLRVSEISVGAQRGVPLQHHAHVRAARRRWTRISSVAKDRRRTCGIWSSRRYTGRSASSTRRCCTRSRPTAAAAFRFSATASIRRSTTSPSSPRCSRTAAATTVDSSSPRPGSRRRSSERATPPACRSGLRVDLGAPRYHLSFWSIPYRTGAGCFFQIPYMSGYGGNMVMLLPNGVSAFRFADAMSYDNESMVLAAEAIRPFCTPATSAVAAPPRTPLTAAEIRTEVTGHTFYSGRGHTFFDASGLIYSGSPDSVDVGRWSITAEGQFCRTWNVSDSARPRCFRVYRDGETFEFHPGRSMVRRDRQARTRQSGALLTQARSERPPGLAVPTAPAGIQPEALNRQFFSDSMSDPPGR